MTVHIITKNEELEDFCHKILALTNDDQFVPLAIDTEFIREIYYYPKLCLIQMAQDIDHPILVDPMGDIDLTPLKEVLLSPRIVKIFHAAYHDIEIFHYIFGIVPTPVFDTQIAAMACISHKKLSYDKLIKNTCHISIDKSQQVSQWDQRPLTDAQISYATSDVTYLCQAYDHIYHLLEQQDRLQLIKEEMKEMFAEENFSPSLDDFWLKMEPPKKDEKSVHLFRNIVTWREKQAAQKNVPRSFILRNQDISVLLSYPVSSVDEVHNNRAFPIGLKKRLGKISSSFWIMLEESRSSSTPLPIRKKRQRGHISKLYLVFAHSLLEEFCQEKNISSQLLAQKKDIVDLLTSTDHHQCRLMKGWRKPFGEKLIALKEGKISFVMKNNTIKIQEHNFYDKADIS